MSRRVSFAYHYGPIVQTGSHGLPEYDAKDPVDIRIDNSRSHVHLHFGAPGIHHPQSAVKGLQLDELGPFDFLRAIFKHRSSGRSLDEVFGFRVE